MVLDLNQLPQDTQLLHQLVKELAGDLAGKQKIIADQQQEIQEKAHTNQILERRLAELNRYRFGKRSQKVNPAQLALWHEALDGDIAETEQAIGKESSNPTHKKQAKRKPLPAELPRKTITYEHANEHCECGHPLHRMGVQSCEELHWKPATFHVTRHEQIKYGCRHCDKVTTAAKPSRPIEKGILGSSMLAYLIVSKYQDHLPVDRVRHICERSQITLPLSTLNDALGRCGWILRPLVERISHYVLHQNNHIHTDDTVIPVIDATRGKTKQGRLWVYLHTGTDGPPAVLFDYTPNRTQARPLSLLKDYQGYLQADAYPGYDKLYHSGDIKEVACWAHVRAKFEQVEKRTQSPIAQHALALIAQLYGIEKTVKEEESGLRQEQRQTQSLPILACLKTHLETSLRRVAGNSDIAVPIGYALKRWSSLTRYCEDGRLNIDNNPAERCIRPITIGRKNWVFAGSDLAAERSAIIYSLVETCKLNAVDPFAYFTDVLDRIADHPNQKIDELLPFNWKPAQHAS